MNSFSLSKLFTAVLFVLVAGNAWAAEKKPVTQGRLDYDSCLASCDEKFKNNYGSRCSESDKGDDKQNCRNKADDTCRASCKTDYDTSKSDEKDATKTCTDAMKEWGDKAGDFELACTALDKSLGKSCSDRLNACKSKIDGTFNSSSQSESGDQSLGIIKQMVMAKLSTSSDAIANDVATGGVPCVKQFDAKTKRENEKEFTKEKRELDARVKKEKDEETKQNEKLREKKDDITKKISELDAKLVKAGEARATKANDTKTAYQKRLVESAKAIRSLGTAILQEDQKLTKARFAVQTGLLELTDAKILNRCKQQLLSVRNALVSNAPASATSATDAQIKGVKDLIGKGPQAKVNLDAYLKQIKEACFEQENTKKQNLQLQATQDAETSASRVAELNASIADENKSLKIAKDANDAADTQAATEKTNEEKQRATDASNLNAELQNFQDSINEKIKNSKEEAAKITTEIQDLTLKKDFDVGPAFADAQKAVKTGEELRAKAYDVCECKGAGKSKQGCTSLEKSATTTPTGGANGADGVK